MFFLLLLDLMRRDWFNSGGAQPKPQIYNLPVAMRIIIEYQKLCYSLFHSVHLLPMRLFREDAQYKSPGHYANPPNDTVPTQSTLRSIRIFTTDGTCTNFSARIISYSRGRCHFAILIRSLFYIGSSSVESLHA